MLVGQVTPLVFLGWAVGSAALRQGYDGWVGAALALTLCKPQYAPVVLLAILLQRRGRALLAFAGAGAAAYAISAPFAGADWPGRYAGFLLRLALQPPNDAIDPAMMQNWRGLFQRWLGGTDATLPLTMLAVALSVVALAALWRWVAARADPAAWDRAWACTLLVGLLTSFHLLYPDLALAIAPAWISVGWRGAGASRATAPLALARLGAGVCGQLPVARADGGPAVDGGDGGRARMGRVAAGAGAAAPARRIRGAACGF